MNKTLSDRGSPPLTQNLHFVGPRVAIKKRLKRRYVFLVIWYIMGHLQ